MIGTDEYKKNVAVDTQKLLKDFKDVGFNFMSELETKYECGGICNEPLFYVTKDVKLGRPNKDCVKEFFKSMSKQAVAFTGTFGVVLILTFLLSISLLCGIPSVNPEPELDEDDDENMPPQE